MQTYFVTNSANPLFHCYKKNAFDVLAGSGFRQIFIPHHFQE